MRRWRNEGSARNLYITDYVVSPNKFEHVSAIPLPFSLGCSIRGT